MYYQNVEICVWRVFCFVLWRVGQINTLNIYKCSEREQTHCICSCSGRIRAKTLCLCLFHIFDVPTIVSSTHSMVPERTWQILTIFICFIILHPFFGYSIRKQLERSEFVPSRSDFIICYVASRPVYVFLKMWWN